MEGQHTSLTVAAALVVLTCSLAAPAVAAPDGTLLAGDGERAGTNATGVTHSDSGTSFSAAGVGIDATVDAATPDDGIDTVTETIDANADGTVAVTTEMVTGATEPVTEPIEPITDTSETVTDATGAVTETTEDATMAATEGLYDGTETLSNATEILSNATETLGDAATGTATTITEAVTETTETIVSDADLNPKSVLSFAPATEPIRPISENTLASPTTSPHPPTLPHSTTRRYAARAAAQMRDVSLAPAAGGSSSDGAPGRLPGAPAAGVALGAGAVVAGALLRQGTAVGLVAGGAGAGTAHSSLRRMAVDARRSMRTGWRSALDRLLRVLAVLRYSAHDDSDPLEHEPRAAVFTAIEASPGTYLSEVSETAGVPVSTVRYHVRVLEREGLVAGARLRGKRRFYPADADGIELTAALNDAATAALLDALARHGAASVSDLAADIGRDPSTVSHHLQRLDADGLVVREREGKAMVSRLAPEVRATLHLGAGGGQAGTGTPTSAD